MPRRYPPHPDNEQDRTFLEARSIHESILANPADYPSGWVEQAQFRERYDLPPFRPPRLSDGTKTHEVIAELEGELGIEICFVARDVDNGWYVEVNGAPAFPVDRYRDDAANTVVALCRDQFVSKVKGTIDA